MKINRTFAGIAATACLALSLSACSTEEEDPTPVAPAETPSQTTPDEEPMDEGMDEGAASQVFGPGCDAVPMDGAGSFDGMVKDPVATAASNNPLLSTLVTAVGEAGLGDTLNDAEDITVFAPTNEAFGKIPEDALNSVLADKDLLTSILTYHVVPGQLGPDEVAGKHKTLNGATLTVKGSGEDFTVNDAAVVCGNVPTANATVYIIDTVLMPN